MRYLTLALAVSFCSVVVAADAHAAKKPPKAPKAPKAAKKGAKDDGLTTGVECVLSKPLAVKIMTGKKGKPAKLSKDSRVRIAEIGATVKLSTPSGEAQVKRALLAKVCVPSEGDAPAPTEAALDAASTAQPEAAPDAQSPTPPAEPAPTPAPEPTPAEPAPQPEPQPEPQPQADASTSPPPADTTAPVVDNAAADPDRAEKLSRAKAMRGLAITFTILGVGGLGAGGAFLALALINDQQVATQIDAYNMKAVRTQEEFNEITARSEQVKLYRNIAIISGAAGLALLTTGIILFAVGENPNKYATVPKLQITPTFAITPTGGAFGLVGRF